MVEYDRSEKDMPTWIGSNKIIIATYFRQMTSGSVKSQNGSVREKKYMYNLLAHLVVVHIGTCSHVRYMYACKSM